MKHSLKALIEEVDYELKQRGHVYPKIRLNHPKRGPDLDLHVERMEAIKTVLWTIVLDPQSQERLEKLMKPPVGLDVKHHP